MTGRNRRGSRGAGTKARIGVAAAVLIGGGAAGVAVVAANHHGTAGTTANDAGFIMNINHHIGQEAALSSALNTWGRSHQRAMNTLAQMVPMRNFTQQWGGWHHRTQYAAQRGVVVLATKQFLVVKSANGGLHLWWLTGTTAFQNVTANPTGMTAMTGNNTAAMKAVTQSNTVTAQTVMAGSTNAVTQAAAPTRTTTLTITTGTLTITITITPTTAVVGQASATATGTVAPTVSPSATMSVSPTATVSATPTITPTVTPSPTTTATQPVTTATHGVAAGDLVMVTGVRVHGRLIAKLVLFSAPATTMATPTATPSVSISATATSTAVPTATPRVTSTSSFTGTHS